MLYFNDELTIILTMCRNSLPFFCGQGGGGAETPHKTGRQLHKQLFWWHL